MREIKMFSSTNVAFFIFFQNQASFLWLLCGIRITPKRTQLKYHPNYSSGEIQFSEPPLPEMIFGNFV